MRRLFSSSSGNHQEIIAEGHLVDFHGCGSFHRPPLPNVLSFCFFFFLVKIPTFDSKVFAPASPSNDDRQPRQPGHSRIFAARALSGHPLRCGGSDPIPPQHRELVQRISPVVHSVPAPFDHDVFQGHVEQLQCRLFAWKRSPRLDDLA